MSFKVIDQKLTYRLSGRKTILKNETVRFRTARLRLCNRVMQTDCGTKSAVVALDLLSKTYRFTLPGSLFSPPDRPEPSVDLHQIQGAACH